MFQQQHTHYGNQRLAHISIIITILLVAYYPLFSNYITNFEEVCRSINKTPRDEESYDYKNLLKSFLKTEASCNCEINGSNQLLLRGKFRNKNVENITRNFIRKYLVCFSCKSPKTYIKKINKKLWRQCLICSSVSCIT